MNSSVATTGGISATSAALIPVIQWLFPAVPAPVAVSLSAGVIVLVHALHELAVRKRWYPSDASVDTAPKNAEAAPVAAQQISSTI